MLNFKKLIPFDKLGKLKSSVKLTKLKIPKLKHKKKVKPSKPKAKKIKVSKPKKKIKFPKIKLPKIKFPKIRFPKFNIRPRKKTKASKVVKPSKPSKPSKPKKPIKLPKITLPKLTMPRGLIRLEKKAMGLERKAKKLVPTKRNLKNGYFKAREEIKLELNSLKKSVKKIEKKLTPKKPEFIDSWKKKVPTRRKIKNRYLKQVARIDEKKKNIKKSIRKIEHKLRPRKPQFVIALGKKIPTTRKIKNRYFKKKESIHQEIKSAKKSVRKFERKLKPRRPKFLDKLKKLIPKQSFRPKGVSGSVEKEVVQHLRKTKEVLPPFQRENRISPIKQIKQSFKNMGTATKESFSNGFKAFTALFKKSKPQKPKVNKVYIPVEKTKQKSRISIILAKPSDWMKKLKLQLKYIKLAIKKRHQKRKTKKIPKRKKPQIQRKPLIKTTKTVLYNLGVFKTKEQREMIREVKELRRSDKERNDQTAKLILQMLGEISLLVKRGQDDQAERLYREVVEAYKILPVNYKMKLKPKVLHEYNKIAKLRY